MRKPGINKKVKLTNQLSLLWKRELSQLQADNGLYKYSDKSKMYRKKYLMESVNTDVLKRQIIDVLFERDYSIFDNE